MNVVFEKPNVEQLRHNHMLVDMHFHSRYSHDCSTSVKKIIEKCKRLGVYVALTDHNSIRGVLEGHRLAPGVIKPGIEITTREGKDILVYFYEVEDLARFFVAHVKPHVRNKSSLRSGRTSLPTLELFRALKKYRCVIALPHPFAVGPRMSYQFFRSNGRTHLLQNVHAIEVINQAVPHRRNLAAIGWAAQCKKPMIGGSDGHIIGMLGSAFTAAKAESWEDFLRAILRRKATVVGEEKKLRHHVANMANILREKTKVLENRRIRNGF